ncbi:MAG: carbohydrate kinase family protein [Clostridia bacterium]|nr:carbohydrate kinase family protein [Clostridia bacterium]
MGYIAGIGGANMDIHGRSDQQLVMRDSNPGTLHMSLGGVCRNICENLARLGADVRLITVVGDDAHGRNIIEGCMEAGIDMSAARVLRGERSSCYISLMDGDGDMLLAMSDMHIIKKLNAQLVDESRDVLCGADMVVCDGNLSVKTIERLTQVCDRPMYIDPVSTAWAREIKPFIGYFDTVKPNRMELAALTDCPVDTMRNLELACDILRGRGVRRVFVSLGRDGMFYKGPEGAIYGVSRPYDGMVNATGAGDASMAGIVWASREGLDAETTLHTAMAAGMVAISSPDTISREMSLTAIKNMIKEYIK